MKLLPHSEFEKLSNLGLRSFLLLRLLTGWLLGPQQGCFHPTTDCHSSKLSDAAQGPDAEMKVVDTLLSGGPWPPGGGRRLTDPLLDGPV